MGQEERNYKRGCRAHKGGHGRGEAGQRSKGEQCEREGMVGVPVKTKKREENTNGRERERERRSERGKRNVAKGLKVGVRPCK